MQLCELPPEDDLCKSGAELSSLFLGVEPGLLNAEEGLQSPPEAGGLEQVVEQEAGRLFFLSVYLALFLSDVVSVLQGLAGSRPLSGRLGLAAVRSSRAEGAPGQGECLPPQRI
jgi:hypothetical protein